MRIILDICVICGLCVNLRSAPNICRQTINLVLTVLHLLPLLHLLLHLLPVLHLLLHLLPVLHLLLLHLLLLRCNASQCIAMHLFLYLSAFSEGHAFHSFPLFLHTSNLSV